MTTFNDLMMSLDRCEHGRHAVDNCFECPDAPMWRNPGNKLIVPGTQIGWTHGGNRIVVPDPSREADLWPHPERWVQPR